MLNDSAQLRDEIPHSATSSNTNTINDAVKRRAQSLIKDRSIDAAARAVIRYAVEIDDPMLSELVRRADAGEPIIDGHLSDVNNEVSIEEKLEWLAEMLCRAGDEPETRAAALLVLMSTLENSTNPKVLANHVKHLAFARCGELNCYGMVEAQIATIEGELFAATPYLA
ncbi:MAG TPA: hypothetical protein VKB02_08685 [Pyrinomonadaceae bacterium]|nr:hypothetical protein [Pyrinomonadaceae bacterium]